jgi:hypothetical protein
MKRITSLVGLSFLVLGAIACKADPTPYDFTDGGPAVPATKGQTMKLDFETAQPNGLPGDFAHVLGNWRVEQEPGVRFLAQVGEYGDPDFPRLLVRGTTFTNVHVKVRCAMRAGDTDRACGILWRAKDSDNYYVARANALEDNVNLYKVVNNDRVQFAGAGLGVSSSEWHTLEIFHEGSHIRLLWDMKEVAAADDSSFPAGGKVGVWTKADSVTAFDDFEATEL